MRFFLSLRFSIFLVYLWSHKLKTQETMSQVIKNREKLERPLIYEGLSQGFQLTDIDFLWEYKNKFLFIGEVKEAGKDITIGQKITTTRIIDSWNSVSNHKGLIIFAQHDPNVDTIHLKECLVTKIYDGKWREVKKEITVKDFIAMFLKKYDIKFN